MGDAQIALLVAVIFSQGVTTPEEVLEFAAKFLSWLNKPSDG